jgi:hypothetical protein
MERVWSRHLEYFENSVHFMNEMWLALVTLIDYKLW